MTTLYQVTITDCDENGKVLRVSQLEVPLDELLDVLPPLYTYPDGTPLPSPTSYVFQAFQLEVGGGPNLVDWSPTKDPRPPVVFEPSPSNDI